MSATLIPFVLHAAAETASAHGLHDLAAQLFQEAAEHAMTVDGARVLIEKAIAARKLAERQKMQAS